MFYIYNIYFLNLEGIFNDSLQPENISLILVTLEVSHFDISGKEINEIQLENREFILITLEVSHFDISGKEVNALQ